MCVSSSEFNWYFAALNISTVEKYVSMCIGGVHCTWNHWQPQFWAWLIIHTDGKWNDTISNSLMGDTPGAIYDHGENMSETHYQTTWNDHRHLQPSHLHPSNLSGQGFLPSSLQQSVLSCFRLTVPQHTRFKKMDFKRLRILWQLEQVFSVWILCKCDVNQCSFVFLPCFPNIRNYK